MRAKSSLNFISAMNAHDHMTTFLNHTSVNYTVARKNNDVDLTRVDEAKLSTAPVQLLQFASERDPKDTRNLLCNCFSLRIQ